MARGSRRVFSEALNPHFGYYYNVKKSLYAGRTEYQKIELIDTEEFGRVLLLDDITQVAEKNDYQYHEPMVHPAMCAHPNPRDILVIGGGDGGILREVLKHSCVRSVVFAELDPQVVAFARQYLKDVNQGAFDDPRVETVFGDGRAYVEHNPGRFDVVIMDMTDPFGPSKMLYTREFFRAIKRSFRNRRGTFVMHSESPIVRPLAYATIIRTLSSVFEHVNPLYTYIQMYAVLWSITVSSDTVNIAAKSPAAIDKSLSGRGVRGLHLYNGETHRAMLVSYPYVDRIRRRRVAPVTDRNPDFPDDFHDSSYRPGA